MPLITLKNKLSIDVTVRNATLADINHLMTLNQKWQKQNLENINNGYIGARISEGTFQELIKKDQVSCALFNGEIIGYYLLNDVSKDGIIGTHQEIVETLKSAGKLNKQLKICVGAQAVVDKDYMGSGIRQLMLANLKQNMQGKFDYFFATIAKDNPRAFTAHTRDGWEVIDENDNLFYVIFKV